MSWVIHPVLVFEDWEGLTSLHMWLHGQTTGWGNPYSTENQLVTLYVLKVRESGGFSEMEGRAVDGFDLDVFFGVFFVTSKFIFEEIQEL